MNKKDLSERDICTKFINPAIEKAAEEKKLRKPRVKKTKQQHKNQKKK